MLFRSMFAFEDKGVFYFGGEGMRPRIMRGQYVNGPAAKVIVARARVMREAAGRITGYALGEDHDGEVRSFAADVLLVFGADEKLWSETIAERLREAVQAICFAPPMENLSITVSVGVATFSSASVDGADSLLLKADKALYRAKNGGRNRVEIMSG